MSQSRSHLVPTRVTRPARRARRCGTVLLLTLVVAVATGSSLRAADPLESRLFEFWRGWSQEVDPLMTEPERELFADLETDREKERFLEGFWRAREGGLERWRLNQRDAAQLRYRAPEAHRLVLLFGKPKEIWEYDGCRSGVRPLEVWMWDDWLLERQGGEGAEVFLVLVQKKRFDPRTLAPWEPGDYPGLGVFTTDSFDEELFLDRGKLGSCFSASETGQLRTHLRDAASVDELFRLAPWPVPPAGAVSDLATAIERAGSAALTRSRLELRTNGSQGGRYTVVEGRVGVESSRLRRLEAGPLFDRLELVGDIWAADRLVDNFAVVQHLAGSSPAELVEVAFYRRLLPGGYLLRLRVADRYGVALLREERAFEVPVATEPAVAPPGNAGGLTRLLREDVVAFETFPSVELLPVPASGAARVTVHAITTGGPIDAVEFVLEGRSVSVDRDPPYSIELPLPASAAKLEAVALDPEGRALRRHERWLRREPRPFSVRFGAVDADSSEVPFDLRIPEGEVLREARCYLGHNPTRVLSAMPWTCPLPDRVGTSLDFVRVTADLESGESVEEVLFLGPTAPERVEVRLVELYVSVFDGSGRPVRDLLPAEFVLREGGRERGIDRVESLENLPLNVALLMDLSASMGRRTRIAAESADRFFQRILTADDRASLLGFNQDLHLIVPFTDDARELSHGARGLRAQGSTRLYDAIVYALSQFAGLESRRALIVLSDGADVDSDFPFAHVLDAAVRAGVAVYPVSLTRSPEEAAPAELRQLASRTGGSAFTVGSVDELDRVYRRIEEELRSQYLLVYRPLPVEGADLEFRELDVGVVRAGLTTRNVHGYYP